MKSGNIQRGIRPAHQPAGKGAPLSGRVARLRHVDHFSDGNETRDRMIMERKATVTVMSALFWMAALLVIGGFVTLWLLSQVNRVGVEVQSQLESNVRVASKFPSPSREQSLELVRRALETRDPQAVAELYRNGAARSAEILYFLSAL